MARDPKDRRAALDRLDKALVEDILGTTDEEILAELVEEGEDPNRLADYMRVLFETTVLKVGRDKLTAAKQALAAARTNANPSHGMNLAEARRRFESKVTKGADTVAKLTMAARSGWGQSKRDVDSAIEDLAELGALDDEDGE